MEQEGDSLFYDYFQKQSSGYSCKCCDEVLDSELLEGLVSHFKNCHPTEFKVAFVREYERKLAALHYWYKSMSTDEATLPLKTQIGIERAKCQDLYWNHLRQELLSSDEGMQHMASSNLEVNILYCTRRSKELNHDTSCGTLMNLQNHQSGITCVGSPKSEKRKSTDKK